MQFPDFAKCKERSLSMAESMSRQNIDVKVAFGLYRPSTPKETWDDRWQVVHTLPPYEFSHFWLEVEKMFWDCSLLQFGEKGFLWSKMSDTHYVHLGYISLDDEIIEEFGPFRIKWHSFSTRSGVPTMIVEAT